MTQRPTVAVVVTALALVASSGATPNRAPSGSTEVVVTLGSPPLARVTGDREAARRRIAREHRAFVAALHERVPAATIRWQYRLVANGVSVVLPRAEVGELAGIPGVSSVFTGVTYSGQSGPAGGTIRARTLPGLPLAMAGDGVKIGIIDDGIEQDHAFFSPAGYTMPPGFPKGQVAYTTAKVIVARAFAPPGSTWRNARKPYDPVESGHATHVAGIAAGNASTDADGEVVSGVAPRAYLGNYKALTVPSDAAGLNGNAPELVAAIEAAVADGMDVINLSIGEVEIEPTRDIVALALDAAADAGVVPVVAAGNDFEEYGEGSVSSPGSSEKAITVGSTLPDGNEMSEFSSSGPSPISLRVKPDVVAPGSRILSSTPDGWTTMSGTSMAAPHVAGAAALLVQLHPDWTPEHVKAALVSSARPVGALTPLRIGGGLVDVAAANLDLLTATPTSVSLGLLRPGRVRSDVVELAGSETAGPEDWTVDVTALANTTGAAVQSPRTVTVPGSLRLRTIVPAAADDGDLTGYVTLRHGTDERRIPYWGRVTRPRLAGERRTLLARPGIYSGNTRGRASRIVRYRYPEGTPDSPFLTSLRGPEQVFRVKLDRARVNFGVVVVNEAKGVKVGPRVVRAGDENQLTGYAGLPIYLNPYTSLVGEPVPAAGAIRPVAGAYDVVFDSRSAATAGAFSFRFWIDDVTPPQVRLTTQSVIRGEPLRLRVSDLGSGVDPESISAEIGSAIVDAHLEGGELLVETINASPGTPRLRVSVADYQESKNMENVGPILPNTRVLTTRVTITPAR